MEINSPSTLDGRDARPVQCHSNSVSAAMNVVSDLRARPSACEVISSIAMALPTVADLYLNRIARLVPPPYLASTEWFQSKTVTLKTRDFTRCLIESNSPDGMVLTVPVVGGSSAVKRLKPTDLEVSDHGDWTRIHLGAIEAAYGREPYFQHLFPEIAEIIANHPQHLAHLDVLLMEKMMEFIGYGSNIPEIKALREEHPERCAAIAQRLESKIDPRHSFLEPIFRLGPDSIFLL